MVIWSNIDLDYEEWRSDLEYDYPNLTEQERYSLMMELNYINLEAERSNLDIQLNEPILIIGDLGLWHGRAWGYTEIESGNIMECLYSGHDYSEWYVDKQGDLRCRAIHHDGTNHYLYRVYKNGISEEQKDLLKEKIYDGTVTRDDIVRATNRLGDVIAKTYGFHIPKQKCMRKSVSR